MLRITARAATAVLLILVTGVPIVGALCVRQCDAPNVAALDSPCHEPAADTTRLAPLRPDACNPFLTGVVATIDRTGTTVGSAPASPAHLQFAVSAPDADALPRTDLNRPTDGGGVRFGTQLPLRI